MALTKGMLHMELTTHFKLGSQQPLIFQTQHMNLILISCFELKASRVSTHLRGNLVTKRTPSSHKNAISI